MSHVITKDGFGYSFNPQLCAECGGKCCTGESGNIFVNMDEIFNIATFLKLDQLSFREKYLIKQGYKYSLKEIVFEASNDCIFFDREIMGCSIYEVRPQQCRTFPFWDYFKTNFNELEKECIGVVYS
jgi:uncharacterized protein